MSKWKIYTPEGFQDILADECATKRKLEEKLRLLFRSCGYNELETPTVEFFDTFASEGGGIPQETMFKFFDQQGRILVLRPDITIPVARITATKVSNEVYPIRYSYIGNVFRYNEYGGGKQNEFTQAGVELLGVSSPESDAEVIATAVNALLESGLKSFKIDIGQVEFFNGLMEETNLPEEDVAKLRMLIERKDYVAIGAMLEDCTIRDDLKKLIFDLPALFGEAAVINKIELLTKNKRSIDALKNIREVLAILEDYGLGEYISVDLGMLRELDYDTGIIFRGFTHDIGFPLLSGGRYDRLVGEFGKNCPATGFSLGLGLLMAALKRQNAATEKLRTDTVICYLKGGRKTAFGLCNELRRQGLTVEMDCSEAQDREKTLEYARQKGIGGIVYVFSEQRIELIDANTGAVSTTSLEELKNG